MAAEIHQSPARAVAGMMKLLRERRQRIAGIEGLRGGRAGSHFVRSLHDGAADGTGAMRHAREEAGENLGGSCVSMLRTATCSRYSRWPQCSQYQENPSSSSGPRRRSTTMPTLPAGRCGECGTCGGRRNTSPARMGTSIRRSVLHRLKHHVALHLVEELFARIVMKILARIRSADRHDDEFAVLKQQLVADRRLEQLAVLARSTTAD